MPVFELGFPNIFNFHQGFLLHIGYRYTIQLQLHLEAHGSQARPISYPSNLSSVKRVLWVHQSTPIFLLQFMRQIISINKIIIISIFCIYSKMLLQWETQISLTSTFYTHLKCKILDVETEEILDSLIINNVTPTKLTIDKKPYDITLILFNDYGTIIEEFTFHQMQSLLLKAFRGSSCETPNSDVTPFSSSMASTKYFMESSYGKQGLSFQKEGDACSINMHVNQRKEMNIDLSMVIEQMIENERVWSIANTAYKAIQEKALKRIRKCQEYSRKFSMQITSKKNTVFREPSLNSTLNNKLMEQRYQGKKQKLWIKKVKETFNQNKRMEESDSHKWMAASDRFLGTIQKHKPMKKHKVNVINKLTDPENIKLISVCQAPPSRDDYGVIGKQIIKSNAFIRAKITQSKNNSRKNKPLQQFDSQFFTKTNAGLVQHRRQFSDISHKSNIFKVVTVPTESSIQFKKTNQSIKRAISKRRV